MAIKELKKAEKTHLTQDEKSVEKFIAKGGSLSLDLFEEREDDHRLTLRIPKELVHKIDEKRKQRVGKISRNLWILETLDKATRK
jgi:hypothetical protein